MRPIGLWGPFVLICMFFGCASTDVKVYETDKMKQVTTWHVGFTYENRIDETSQKNTGEAAVRSIRGGETSANLQLRDDIFFHLKDDPTIKVTQDAQKADGFIKLNPVYHGWFISVDVVLYNSDDEMLARIRVNNGDRNATIKDNNDFAEYAAESISELLKAKH